MYTGARTQFPTNIKSAPELTAHILGNLRFISDISVSAYSTSLICFQLRFDLHVKSDRNPL